MFSELVVCGYMLVMVACIALAVLRYGRRD